MNLFNLIQHHAQAQAQAEQWEAVSAALNDKSVAVCNPKQWTLGEIEQSLGTDAARIIAGAIKAAAAVDPLMESVFVAVSTSGIQLHTDERQALVASIGQQAGLPAEQIAAMQALGVVRKSPAEVAGLGTVTGDQCREAWALQERQQMLQELQQQFDGIKNQIGTAEQPLAVAALRAMANELEAV